MTVYLLRHARAGRRSTWKGDDEHRPLTKVGRRQAAALVTPLAGAGITRILSSPSVRCRETVEPLARRLRVPIDLTEALAEGAPLHEILRLVDKAAGENTVLCTHGDVLQPMLEHLRDHGVDVGTRRKPPKMEKGSYWELRVKSGAVTRATYQPPPTSGG